MEIWKELEESIKQNNLWHFDTTERIIITIAILEEEGRDRRSEAISQERKEHARHNLSKQYESASQRQKEYLDRLGIIYDKDIKSGEASRLIDQAKKTGNSGKGQARPKQMPKPTGKQIDLMKKLAIKFDANMTRQEASELIGQKIKKKVRK